MQTGEEIRNELREPAHDLGELIPEVMTHYGAMARAAMKDGQLSRGVKELVALAIAVTRECDGCIVAHARGCARAGVTREQVGEVMGVAVAMNGGPGTVWAPRALRCFDEARAVQNS